MEHIIENSGNSDDSSVSQSPSKSNNNLFSLKDCDNEYFSLAVGIKKKLKPK